MLILFTVREYCESDFPRLTEVYKSAFAEPPWDEFMKCPKCGVNYGIKESNLVRIDCKKCRTALRLVEFWSNEEISKDLDFALSQEKPKVLVAELEDQLCGFVWGYKLPIIKFPFLEGYVDSDSSYMDEIAVSGKFRRRGVGKILGREYLERCEAREIVLRTDVRNNASVGLFCSLGFENTGVRDPEFEWRAYFKRKLR